MKLKGRRVVLVEEKMIIMTDMEEQFYNSTGSFCSSGSENLIVDWGRGDIIKGR